MGGCIMKLLTKLIKRLYPTYKLTFDVIDVSPSGRAMDSFQVTREIKLWFWEDKTTEFHKVKEALPPFGIWSDVILVKAEKV
ncbi:hypothetical protein [Salmonella phage vB_SenM-S16]|uniref:Uncharacterized protein n=1 Tax=Salmonella phage S16 TaxID=1087482 RepID=M1HDK5_BPS16|nr:hypothetical protein I133_gp073 [Salmonella phage vB_SenM-S16]AGE48201.1 hypothetical protein [Salmonella phage vB_SenM-S16]